MIEISIITAVINNFVMLMIGAIIGIVAICIIRAAKDEPEKDDWNVLICMVDCKRRIPLTELLGRRLRYIGKEEYIRICNRDNKKYQSTGMAETISSLIEDGEPIDDN